MRKGVVYYSDGLLDPTIHRAVRERLYQAVLGRGSFPVVSVTLKPIEDDFGSHIVVPLERSVLSMFKQILHGLESLTDVDVVFLAEHDVLYSRSHFDFVPEKDNLYYYNQNVWQLRSSDGHALHYPCSKTSGLCAWRDLLIEHYTKRVERVEEHGFNRAMGFEPGTHRRPEGIDGYGSETWMSAVANIDIRHDANLTESRWHKSQFRNQKNTEGWTEASGVPGWGQTEGRFTDFLSDLAGVTHG